MKIPGFDMPDENLGEGDQFSGIGDDGMPIELDEHGRQFVIRLDQTTGMPYRHYLNSVPNQATPKPVDPPMPPSGINGAANPYQEILDKLPEGYSIENLGQGRVNVKFKGITLPTHLSPISQGPGGRIWQFGQGSSSYVANPWIRAQQRDDRWDYQYLTSADRASLFIQNAINAFSGQRAETPQDALSKTLAQGDYSYGLAAAVPVPWNVNRSNEILASQTIGFSVFSASSDESASLGAKRSAVEDFSIRLAHDIGNIGNVPVEEFAKRGYTINDTLTAFEAGSYRDVRNQYNAVPGQEAISTNRTAYVPWDPAKNRGTIERGGVISKRYEWERTPTGRRLVEQIPANISDPNASYVKMDAFMQGDEGARAGMRSNMAIAPTLTSGGYYSYERQGPNGKVLVDKTITGFKKSERLKLRVDNLYDLVNDENPTLSFRNLEGLEIKAGSRGERIGTYVPAGSDKPFEIRVPGNASNSYMQDVTMTLPETFDPVSGKAMYNNPAAQPTTFIGEKLKQQVPGLNIQYAPVPRPVLSVNYIQEGDEKYRTAIKAGENIVPMGFQISQGNGSPISIDAITDEIKTPNFFTYNVWGGRTAEQKRGIISTWAQEMGTPEAQGVLQYYDKNIAGRTDQKDTWELLSTRYRRLTAGSNNPYTGSAQEFGNQVFESVFSGGEAGSPEWEARQERNAQNFGMFYKNISYPLLMTPENYRLERRNIERSLRSDPSLQNADSATIEGMIDRVLTSQGMQGKNVLAQVTPSSPSLIVSNVVTPRQLEFANKSTANYAMQLALAHKTPEFASALGLDIGDPSIRDAAQEAQFNLVSWRSYQLGLNKGGNQLPPNTVNIEGETATRLMSYLRTADEMGSPEWYAGIGDITGGNPNDPLYFPSLKTLYPGRGVAEAEQYTEFGEQIGASTRSWTKGLAGLIQASYFSGEQTPEQAHVEGMKAIEEYWSYQQNVQAAKGNAAKRLLEKDIISGLGGREVESSLINPGEAWISGHQVNTVLRKLGLSGKDLKQGREQYQQLAEKGLLSAIDVRYPQLSLGHSLVGAKLVSDAEMISRMPGGSFEEQKQRFERFSQNYRNKLVVSPGFNQQTVADNDLDNMVRLLGITLDKDRNVIPVNGKEVDAITRRTTEEVEAEELKGFGSLARANAANADVNEVEKLFNPNYDAMGSIFSKGGRVEVEKLQQAAIDISNSKTTGMGVSDNLGIDLVAAMAARGASSETIDRMATTTQAWYQEAIDMRAKGFEAKGGNLPTMIAFASANQARTRDEREPYGPEYLSVGTNELKEGSRFTRSYRMPLENIGGAGELEHVMNIATLATKPSNIAGKQEYVYGPEQLANFFSHDPTRVDELKSRLEAVAPNKYASVLHKFLGEGEGQPGYYENLRHVPAYQATLISTWRKTHRLSDKPEETAEIERQRAIFDKALDRMGGNTRREVASAAFLASMQRKEAGADILTPAAMQEAVGYLPVGSVGRRAGEAFMRQLNIPLPEELDTGPANVYQNAQEIPFGNEQNASPVPAPDPDYALENLPPARGGRGRRGGGTTPPPPVDNGYDDAAFVGGSNTGGGGQGNNNQSGGNQQQSGQSSENKKDPVFGKIIPYRPPSPKEVDQMFKDAQVAYSRVSSLIGPELERIDRAAQAAGINIFDEEGQRHSPDLVTMAMEAVGASLPPSKQAGRILAAQKKVEKAMRYDRIQAENPEEDAIQRRAEVRAIANDRIPGGREFQEAAFYGRYTDSKPGTSEKKIVAQLDPDALQKWNDNVERLAKTTEEASQATGKHRAALQKEIEQIQQDQDSIIRNARLSSVKGEIGTIEQSAGAGLPFDSVRLGRLQKERDKLSAEETDIADQRQPTNLSRLGRNLFGGWGLMYMRSVGNIMLEGAGGVGYNERQALQLAETEAGVSSGGSLASGTNASQYYRNMMALTGSLGNPRESLAMLSAANPIMRTIGGVGLSGLSGFAASEWAAGTLASSGMGQLPRYAADGSRLAGTGAAGFLSTAAPFIAGGVMAGSMLLGAYSGSFDTQGLAMQTARAQMGPGEGTYNLSAALSNPQAAMSTTWNMIFAPDRMAQEKRQQGNYTQIMSLLNGVRSEDLTDVPIAGGNALAKASEQWRQGYAGVGLSNIYQQVPGVTRGEVANVLSEDILSKSPFVSQAGAIAAGTFYAYNNQLQGAGAGAAYGQAPNTTDQLRAIVATQLGNGVNLTQLFAKGLAATGTPITSSLAPSGQAARMMEQFYSSQAQGAQGMSPEMQQMLETGFGVLGQTQGAAWAKFNAPSILGRNGAFMPGSLAAEGISVASLSANPERLAYYQQMNALNNQVASMLGGNAPYISASQIIQQTGNMSRQQIALQSANAQTSSNWINNLYGGNALQWGQIANMEGVVNLSSLPAMQTTFGTSIGAEYAAFTGYNMLGQQTGGNWGQQSLQMGGVSAQTMAQRIWAPQNAGVMSDFSNYGRFGQGYINAQINGTKLANGELVGGDIGAAQWVANQQYSLSMASLGVQSRQLAVNQAFTTGVGLSAYAGTINPQTGQPFGFNTGPFSFNVAGTSYTSQGGGSWGLDDAQRNLGYVQTEYGFGMQQKQMDLQASQFWRDTSLQRQGQMLGRQQGTYEFQYSSGMAEQQFGFGQTMFREQARFMSGRDRRLAEMQNQENVTVYNMETEHRKKEFDFQKQQWRLQDEQYRLRIQEFNETKALQQEQFDMSKRFYEENKRLQEESVKLSRAAWVEQIKSQKESMGIQAASLQLQKEVNDAERVKQNFEKNTLDALNNLNANTYPQVIKYLQDTIPNAFITMVNKILTSMGASTISMGGSSSVSSGGCFIAGTQITMSNNTTKSIEDIQIGDFILSLNVETTTQVITKVSDVFHHQPEETSGYILINGYLGVTPDHLIYVNGQWSAARLVKLGDTLSDENGNSITVETIEDVVASVSVYNLHTNHDSHNYFANGVLVHNAKAVGNATGGNLAAGQSAIVGDDISGKMTGYEEQVYAQPGGGVIITPANTKSAVEALLSKDNFAPEKNTIVSPSTKASQRPIQVNIKIGSREIKRFVVETVEEDIDG